MDASQGKPTAAANTTTNQTEDAGNENQINREAPGKDGSASNADGTDTALLGLVAAAVLYSSVNNARGLALRGFLLGSCGSAKCDELIALMKGLPQLSASMMEVQETFNFAVRGDGQAKAWHADALVKAAREVLRVVDVAKLVDVDTLLYGSDGWRSQD